MLYMHSFSADFSGRGSARLWRHRGTVAQFARILFFVFLVLFVVSLVAGRGIFS